MMRMMRKVVAQRGEMIVRLKRRVPDDLVATAIATHVIFLGAPTRYSLARLAGDANQVV